MRNQLIFEGVRNLESAVRHFEGSVMEFAGVAKGSSHPPISKSTSSPWKPPNPGRLAIYVDASVKGGHTVWAMVVRNHLGKLIYIANRRESDQSPQLAKCKALVWAVEKALNHG